MSLRSVANTNSLVDGNYIGPALPFITREQRWKMSAKLRSAAGIEWIWLLPMRSFSIPCKSRYPIHLLTRKLSGLQS